MRSIDGVKLKINSSIEKALRIIESSGIQMAVIVDDSNRLIGTLSDGDIRRGLLNGLSLNDSIKSLVFTTPTIAKITDTKQDILQKAVSKKLRQIPIVDESMVVVGIELIDELIRPETKPNKVVLMVGGLGSRLHPLTENTPKPMLKVGHKPILQTIVEKFVEYGFTNLIMCVNYKSHVIQDYFGNGSAFGVSIEYVLEEYRMGTAGALGLLLTLPKEPFFVMNGDILTNINFEHLRTFHENSGSIGTMCVREYEFQVPYGVVNTNTQNHQILSIVEKPVNKFFVSAGIYMLSPSAINYIPKNEFFDMPTLFDKLIKNDEVVKSFEVSDYWLDIGKISDYEKANIEYAEIFN